MSEKNEVPLLLAHDAEDLLDCVGTWPLEDELTAIATGRAVVISADELEGLRRDAARYAMARKRLGLYALAIIDDNDEEHARAFDGTVDRALAAIAGEKT